MSLMLMAGKTLEAPFLRFSLLQNWKRCTTQFPEKFTLFWKSLKKNREKTSNGTFMSEGIIDNTFISRLSSRDFQALTLDVIGNCAFAIDSNCQRNRSEMFYVQARNYIKNLDINASWVYGSSCNQLIRRLSDDTYSDILPEMTWFWRLLYRFTGMAAAEISLVDGLSCV